MQSIPSRPQYTAAEVHTHADYLPGFTEPADVFQILNDTSPSEPLWQPVLSTTIVSRLDDGELHVLTGKRAADGNTTHVNVASTPTMRLSLQEAGLLLAENIPFCLEGAIQPARPFVSKSLSPSVASTPDNTDVLAGTAGRLLALKLELGSVLERYRKPIGRASLARCIVGFSYLEDNPAGEPMYEPLIMLGVIVGLESEVAKQIPEKTTSYSNLGWAPIEGYVHGVATKTLLEVIPTASPADEIDVCVRGLCNTTSSAILTDPEEIQWHLTEEGVLPPF